MSVNSKMTALANAIRTKSGVTGLLGLDAMISAVLSIEKKTETTKSITPTLTDQTVTPNEGEVFSEVAVAGVTKELVASLDSNFINSNILPDVSILGLQGTADIKYYYTGNGAPDSTLGDEGDLYFDLDQIS